MYYQWYYDSNRNQEDFFLRTDSVGCLSNSTYAATNPGKIAGFLEAFNSPAMQETRRLMFSGKLPSCCKYCAELETLGGRSYRIKMNKLFGQLIESCIEGIDEHGKLNTAPCYLDLRLSNLCNLSCRMCSFPTSSSHDSVWKNGFHTSVMDLYSNNKHFWEQIEKVASQLTRVYFAGGEPFIHPAHDRLLQMLIELGCAGNIQLAYSSNMTVLPSRTLDFFAHYRSVEIGASCDGLESLYENIRKGAKWSHFVKTLSQARHRATVFLSVTLQRDNIEHLERLIDWSVSQGLRVDLSNILQYPSAMSILTLPGYKRRLLANRYLRLSEKYREKDNAELAEEVQIVSRLLLNA
jgi:MoaA/NifB/PqqE/SkfB family radical SAM enzyme